jgi:hypothetical protein
LAAAVRLYINYAIENQRQLTYTSLSLELSEIEAHVSNSVEGTEAAGQFNSRWLLLRFQGGEVTRNQFITEMASNEEKPFKL